MLLNAYELFIKKKNTHKQQKKIFNEINTKSIKFHIKNHM